MWKHDCIKIYNYSVLPYGRGVPQCGGTIVIKVLRYGGGVPQCGGMIVIKVCNTCILGYGRCVPQSYWHWIVILAIQC